jgi:hypothetical protein
MKTTTAQQHANAYITSVGQKVWAVVGKWNAAESTRSMHTGLTYRQAKSTARAIREAFGYADVVKMVSDAQLLAANGPSGK